MAHLIDEILGRRPTGARKAFQEEMLDHLAHLDEMKDSAQPIIDGLFGGKKTDSESLKEVEVPRTGPSVGMLLSNPIQIVQNQDAEPGQFSSTLNKSPARLADVVDDSDNFPACTRRDTEAAVVARAPSMRPVSEKLVSNWVSTIPDHEFDPKLDAEAEYYPLFSMYKSMVSPVTPPTEQDDDDDDDDDDDGKNESITETEDFEGKSITQLFDTHAKKTHAGERPVDMEDYVRSKYGVDVFHDMMAHSVLRHMAATPSTLKGTPDTPQSMTAAADRIRSKAGKAIKESSTDLDEAVVDPEKMDLLGLWDEHARRSNAKGSGSRHEIVKRIEDHVKDQYGEEGLRTMRLHSTLSRLAGKKSDYETSHVKALLDGMRNRAASATAR